MVAHSGSPVHLLGQPLPDVSVFRDAGSVVVDVSGELDIAGAAILAAVLELGWSDPDWNRRVVVDLSSVGFVSVAALRALVEAHATAEQHRASLSVRTRTRHMARLLRVAGLRATDDPTSG